VVTGLVEGQDGSPHRATRDAMAAFPGQGTAERLQGFPVPHR
jgi:hypothetical protein